MCRGIIALLGAVILSSPAQDTPSILFWNLECYFDPFDDPATRDDEYTPGGARHWTWNRFVRKRDGIAKTIAAASDVCGSLPDVIGLAEVENRMVLRQTVSETILEKGNYGILHRDSPDERGIDVALLYRKKAVKVLNVVFLPVECDRPTRDILYAKMLFHGRDTLHVLVNHWPSKLGGESLSSMRRKAAAGVLNSCIDSIRTAEPGAFVVAMGDFNDTPDNISNLISPNLVNMADSLFKAGMGTIKYQGRWELIDQFWCSGKGMRMQILAPAFLLEEDKAHTGMKPRRTFTGPHNHGGLSDHLPILLK